MTDNKDVLAKSVTADDVNKATADGPVSIFVGPSNWAQMYGNGLLEGIKGANGLPPYGTKSADAVLSETPMIENMWASSVNTAIKKQSALGFTIDDTAESSRRVKESQQLLLNFDGAYMFGIERHLRDYLTTDNGAFIEIIRQSSTMGSRVIGLKHLDSLRCYRTGDPQRPVVYVDRQGRHHLLRDYQVIALSDMPSSRLESFGFGMCAARRAFETILKMVSIETYVREKVSGARNLAIHIVNGITAGQLEGALTSSDTANKGRGYVVYRGSTIIPMLKSEPPSVVTIPLAELPDGFEADGERKDAYLRYANALGVFVGEIQPLSGQGLGTGTQTAILEESADGRGLAGWRKAFEHAMTNRVLPEATTFKFAVSDMKDRKQKAETLSAWAGALKTLIDSKVITAPQAMNLLVDDGYLPKEFLQTDETIGGIVEDDDSISSSADGKTKLIAANNGMRMEQQANPKLRANLRMMQTIGNKLASRRKSVYINDETYVASTPPAQSGMTPDELDALMNQSLPRAKAIVKRTS
jgi:hypothetical protein